MFSPARMGNTLRDTYHIFRSMCLLCVLTVVLPVFAAECEKSLRWSDDPPYSIRDRNGTIRGIDIEMIKAVLAQMGCSARLLEMPWARALIELESGRLDILPGAFKTPERERYAFFSREIGLSPNVLFVRPKVHSKYRLKALSDIVGSDFRLGVQSKVSYGPIYDTLLNDPAFQTRLHTISTRTSGWKMLDAGRIDGQIADEVTGRFELRQLGLDKRVVNSGVVVSTNAATVAFSKRTTDIDFVDRFNQTYSNLVKDGTYASIERRNVN